MKLNKLNYSENKNSKNKNPWSIEGLVFNDKINLIAGKNASGKSRIINLINNLAKVITQEIPVLMNGQWDLEFSMDDKKVYKYILSVEDQKVIKEKIVVENQHKLHRNKNIEIFSEKTKSWIGIKPPLDKLVLHIRRDEKEYPFLENLIKWANSLKGFRFIAVSSSIEVPNKLENLVTLNAVPSVLEKSDSKLVNKTIKEFNTIGYEIESIRAAVKPGLFPANIKVLYIKEAGLSHMIDQFSLSNGMFRALSLLIIINYLILSKVASAILIDDLCEGLDFEKATKFTKLLLDKIKKTKIQLILTSNDENLINTTDIKNWNVLVRNYNSVKAYNYINSKKKFDDFIITGLSNIDLLISDYVTRKK